MAPPMADPTVTAPSQAPSSGRATGSTTVGTLEERLSALLSSSQFTVAGYLNTALGSTESDDDQQQRMAELALQLQLQTQACHEDIGRIGAELQAILPRCAADVGRVGVGLDGLRLDAASLTDAIAVAPEQEVSSSLETLSTLHALQANLSRTKEILTAAATWDTTLEQVAPLLAQQNLPQAVAALATLEKGERALRGMPHPEEREAAIGKTRQQVSTLLQPQLQHALANMHSRLGPLQQCVALYSQLNKMETLQQEYTKMRPTSLHKAWFDYKPSPTEDAGEALQAWLPMWFEKVLTLLTEERKQSTQVFGPELVPEIIMKVFSECFRPILASFKSRLESIYSLDPKGPSKGSLKSICAVYESTLQFLSLAYEAIAGGWLDMVEANLIPGSGGLLLYKDMITVFRQVASPFLPYQERFAQLEAKHSGVGCQAVVQDIRQAISGVSSASTNRLEPLQDATERLQGLASFVFPLADEALARFELLNGGYGATQALQTVDKLLAGHAGELAIAIHTLSTAMTSNEKQLADSFDEQHVLCALEVLKIAGSYRRDMRSFEAKTRERLSVLSERMTVHAAREKEVHDAASGTASSKSSFLLPDSLSVVDIDSYLTQAIYSEVEDMDESYTVLQRLVASDRGAIALYPQVDEATKRLAHSCHSFVFDVCSSVPRFHLSDMSSMAAWKEEKGQDELGSYGTLPQQYITHVGEHMLALVQALEPFASDPDALSLANEVMDGVRNVAVQPWIDFMGASGSATSDSLVRVLMDGKGVRDYVVANAVIEDEELDDDELDETDKASSDFCNAWLDVVGLAVTGRLLERIMRIPSLTTKGCEHINADLNYLVNVFTALGVSGHPHPLLGHVAEIAILGGDELAQRIAARDRADDIDASLRSVEERLAAIRGIAANYRY